jgi:anthranilate 1,2-dioxygenase large subunit
VKGVGGLDDDFDPTCHSLQKLRVESLNGVIFGSFSGAVEPLEIFLGPAFVAQLRRLFHAPVAVLGYQRQRIFGNWKLYSDNVRDPNHGGLLHMFQITFGIARLSAKGGAVLDAEGKHNMSWAAQGAPAAGGGDDYQDTARGDMNIKLRDPSMLQYRKEFPDDLSLTIASIFPNCTFQQIGNTLAVRQFRTKSADEFEVVSTFFGYEGDDAEMVKHRLKAANLAGPAGLVSMEDGEAVEIVHRAIVRDGDSHSVVEFGGKGPVKDQENLVTDVPIRGFWLHYCKLMGITPGGAA